MRESASSALSLMMLLAIPAALAIGQSQQAQLIGRWRSSEVSASGVSAVFEFHGDGQLDSSSALVLEQQFRLIGTDTILLQSKNGREENMELEWDNPDRARIEYEPANISIELVRAGQILDSKNPLLGGWSTAREWNGRKYPARASFFPDGKVIWTTTVRVEHGRYSIENRRIRLEVSGRPIVEGNFAVAEDRLTLPTPNGGEFSFSRF